MPFYCIPMVRLTKHWNCTLRLHNKLQYLLTNYCMCSQDGTPTSKTFEHVTSEIGAEEAEEVGVEHLLR